MIAFAEIGLRTCLLALIILVSFGVTVECRAYLSQYLSCAIGTITFVLLILLFFILGRLDDIYRIMKKNLKESKNMKKPIPPDMKPATKDFPISPPPTEL